MRDWTVSLEWDADVPLTEDLLTAVAEIGGAAGGRYGGHRVGSTVTIIAPDPAAAVTELVSTISALIPGEVASVTVSTTEEADRVLAEPAFVELVGITEIGRILGVTRQRASALQTLATFPAPVAHLASGPVWRRGDLSRFEESWHRKPGRPKAVQEILGDNDELGVATAGPLGREPFG